MKRAPRLVCLGMTAVVLVLGLAGCGVPVDDQPQQIDVPSLDL